MIEIKGLHKKYNNVDVLKDINLTIEDGECFGIVGASGVGKSTLLGCINGLEEYQTGSIAVDGVKIEDLNEKQLRYFRKNIGMIFQNFSLINRKSVYQNIALPMECWGASKADIKKKVYELAEIVGLEDKLLSRPTELSGGQKQRVAIARALTLNPNYILCDECTSALDPKISNAILKLLDSIKKEMGITIIVVTHEMSVVQQICNRMAILDRGQVSEEGIVSKLFMNKSPVLQKLLGEQEIEVPEEGINITFSVLLDEFNNSVLWELAKVTREQYRLLNSQIFQFQNKKYCEITLNVSCNDIEEVKKYLNLKGMISHTSLQRGSLC